MSRLRASTGSLSHSGFDRYPTCRLVPADVCFWLLPLRSGVGEEGQTQNLKKCSSPVCNVLPLVIWRGRRCTAYRFRVALPTLSLVACLIMRCLGLLTVDLKTTSAVGSQAACYAMLSAAHVHQQAFCGMPTIKVQVAHRLASCSVPSLAPSHWASQQPILCLRIESGRGGLQHQVAAHRQPCWHSGDRRAALAYGSFQVQALVHLASGSRAFVLPQYL